MAEVLTTLLEAEQRSSGKDETFVSTPFFPILQNYTKDGERKILVTFNKGYVVSATKMGSGRTNDVKSCFVHTAPKNINDIWLLSKDEDVSFSLLMKTHEGSSVIDEHEIEIVTDEPEITESDNERLIQIDKDGKSNPTATYRMPMCRIKNGKIVSLVLRENVLWQQPAFSNAEQEEEDYGILASPEGALAGSSDFNAPPVTFKNLRVGTGLEIESSDKFLKISLGNDKIVRDQKDFAAYYDGQFWIRKGRIISRTPDLFSAGSSNVGIRETAQKVNPYFTVPETQIAPESGRFVFLLAKYTSDLNQAFTFAAKTQTVRHQSTSYVIDIFEEPPAIRQREDFSFSESATEVWIPIGEFSDGRFVQKHDGPIILDAFIHTTSTLS